MAYIDLDAIRHNLAVIRAAVPPGVRLCPAVKANAYGHGAVAILPALRQAGVDRLAVATLDEAIEVRERRWTGAILVLGRPCHGETERESVALASESLRYGLTCTVSDTIELLRLAKAARGIGRVASVHIKLDTGMGRAGSLPQTVSALVETARSTPEIRVEGIYTHLASADEADLTFARRQLSVFAEATDAMVGTVRHAANTAAIFRLPESHYDMVRPGVSVYGYWPDPHQVSPVPLRPCLRVIGRVIAVKRLPKGHAVGYGCTFVTSRESLVGLVPVGYADGYPRALGNRGVMTLRAATDRPMMVPVIGRVSMDQTVIDLTDVPDVRENEPVVIIHDDPAAPNSVAALARLMGTIPYEVTCGLGRRIRRVTAGQDAATRVALSAVSRYSERHGGQAAEEPTEHGDTDLRCSRNSSGDRRS